MFERFVNCFSLCVLRVSDEIMKWENMVRLWNNLMNRSLDRRTSFLTLLQWLINCFFVLSGMQVMEECSKKSDKVRLWNDLVNKLLDSRIYLFIFFFFCSVWLISLTVSAHCVVRKWWKNAVEREREREWEESSRESGKCNKVRFFLFL